MSACSKMYSNVMSSAKKKPPTPTISASIDRFMINALRLRGGSLITASDGGSDASAIAANVSIMRFIQSIWVTVSGVSVPINAPQSTSIHAVTFTVSWKSRKRCIFW